MRVLVTGGLGLVGAHLVPRLLDRSSTTEIVIVDNHSTGAAPEALASVTGERVSVVAGDVADAVLLDAVMPRTDVVIHLAASTSVDRSIESPSACVTNNVGATVALVDAVCRHRPERVIVVSTDEVWGSIPSPDLADETTPYRPMNPYAASKAACDHLVAAANNTYDLTISTVWFTTLYGPWQMPGKLVSTAIRNRVVGRPVPIYGDGLAVREFTYVADAVEGLLAVFDDGPAGACYVIGSGVRHSALEVGRTVNELAGGDDEWVVWAPGRPGCDQRYAVDSTKIQTELGWAPRVDFEEGIALTLEWWRTVGLGVAGGDRHHARAADAGLTLTTPTVAAAPAPGS